MSSSRTTRVSLAAAILITVTAAVTHSSEDLISKAASLFREKDFSGASALLAKSGDSPQRSFLLGTTALRSGRADESLPLLAAAEQKLPLVADYAILYQGEALRKLKRYQEVAIKVATLSRNYPASLLLRRAEKLTADIFYDAGDFKGALKLYQAFIEKYPSGGDSVEALFQLAHCREETGDISAAGLGYRNIWLNNPATQQAARSQERLKELEKKGYKTIPCTPEELLKRSSSLYTQNEFSAALKTLESIPTGQPEAVTDRVELKSGMNLYRLRQYRQAEKHLGRAAVSRIEGVRSEGRFWLAKNYDRLDQEDKALNLYLGLAGEGKRQEFADDALFEAGGLQRNHGHPAEAAALFEQIISHFPDSKFVGRAQWETGWCRYLAGAYPQAVEIFKKLIKDDTQREKALYWLGRALENSAAAEAEQWFSRLQEEYPAGFYATWRRDTKGVRDSRETLGKRNPMAELPTAAGFDKPRLLASLGMLEEARNEMSAIRRKNGEKKGQFPALSRIYLEMSDYSSAIALFMQNRPVRWETATLPLWTAGYPLAYTELVSRNAAANELSEGLVYALIRAESGFSPAIKSPAGAIGLMQMMPATAKQTAREKGSFNPGRLTSPEYNIKLGTRHLRDLMKEYNGDVIHTAAAYNAGAAALERWRRNMKGLKKDEFIESIPYAETRDYVKKVYASAATYRQLYGLK